MSNQHKVKFLTRKEAEPILRLDQYYDIDRKFAKPGFRTIDGDYNWHCSCVSPYIAGPCGYFFRNFMQNIDKFIKNDDMFEQKKNRNLFKKIHFELMGCLSAHPVYYKSFIDEYGSPLEDLMMEVKMSTIRDGLCEFYLDRKNKYCSLHCIEGSKFCADHDPENKSRIPCPLDPKQSKPFEVRGINLNSNQSVENISTSEMLPAFITKLITKLEFLNQIISDNYEQSVLSFVSPEHDHVSSVGLFLTVFCSELQFSNYVLGLEDGNIHPLVDFTLKNPKHWCCNGFPGKRYVPTNCDEKNANNVDLGTNQRSSTQLIDTDKPIDLAQIGRGAQRHIYQNGCLIRVLESERLLYTNCLYLEFGAGRAGLSFWINNCLASSEIGSRSYDVYPSVWPVRASNTEFVVIDFQSVRYKLETRHRESSNFKRIKMNIADLDLANFLKEIKNEKPVVAVAKHLCGDCTDLSLRCLKNGSSMMKLEGILFALCCHHKCTWEESVGRFWLEREANLTAEEFRYITKLSSWAVCGFHEKKEAYPINLNNISNDHNAQEDIKLIEKNDTNHLNLNSDERIRIGYLCKRLIDWGRLMYIKHELGFSNVHLITYTSTDITLENIAICATNQQIK